MKDNMKNFREASELILKNICVTDELKEKTLEKCINKKVSKIKPIITATFSAALMAFLGIYIFFFHKPAVSEYSIAKSINQENKNSFNNEDKTQEAPKTASSSNSAKTPALVSDNKSNTKNNGSAAQNRNKDIAMKVANNVTQSKNIDTVNQNTKTASQSKDNANKPSDNTPQNKVAISNDKSISSNDSNNNTLIAQAHTSLASIPEPLTVEKAESFFGSKILLPSYIPERFKLTDISIPNNKQKCIKLEYSSDSEYFEILQNKNLSKLEGSENISIGNNTAYVNAVKDEKSNITTTTITWISDNIQYSLSSDLAKDTLIKIAASIN